MQCLDNIETSNFKTLQFRYIYFKFELLDNLKCEQNMSIDFSNTAQIQ